MENIYALTSTKEEIKLDTIQHYKVEKAKRKRPKKLFKRLLLLALVLTASLAVAFNFNAIKEYFSGIFNSLDVPTSHSSDNDVNTEQVDSEAYTYKFSPYFVKEFEVVNETDFQINYDDNVKFPTKAEICDKYGNDAPIMLIVSLSPEEGYANGNGYNSFDEFYSSERNVTSIGTEICANLQKLGLPAIQISFDVGSSAYENSLLYKEAVKKALADYPSIAYVIDISRSLELNQDNSISYATTEIEGDSVPAIDLWCGTNGSQIDDNRLKSILFANKIASEASKDGALLFRRQTVSQYPLFQDFNAICFRADIGSFASSYDDALKSALLFSEQLAKIINS